MGTNKAMGPVDLDTCSPVPLRKTLVLFNQFVTSTAQFLNKFSTMCDAKLQKVASDLSRLEASMYLLEAKINSIPDIAHAEGTKVKADIPDVPDVEAAPKEGAHAPAQATSGGDGPKVKDDPDYARYFKLLKLGMPSDQVKLKMESEGFVGALLDTPDAVLADALKGQNSGAAAAPLPSDEAKPDAPSEETAATAIVPAAGDESDETPQVEALKTKDDPAFAGYFKMLKMGVPLPSVQQKLSVEMDGVDPDILTRPDDPSPNAVPLLADA